MPLDPSIILRGRGVEVEPIDVGRTLAQVAQIQRARQQLTLGELGLAQARREQAQEEALREAIRGSVGPAGQVDYGALEGRLAQTGHLSGLGQVQKMRSGQAQMQSFEAKAAQDELENMGLANDLIHRALLGVQKAPETYTATLGRLRKQLGAKYGAVLDDVPQVYDARFVESALAATVNEKRELEKMKAAQLGTVPIYGEQDGQRVVGQLSPAGGVVVGPTPPGFTPYGPAAYAPQTVKTPTTIYSARKTQGGVTLDPAPVSGQTPLPMTPAQEQQFLDDAVRQGATLEEAHSILATVKGQQPRLSVDLAAQAETRKQAEARGQHQGATQVEVLEKAKQALNLMESAEAKQAEAMSPGGALARIKALKDVAGAYRPGGRGVSNLLTHDQYQRRVDLEKHLENIESYLGIDALAEMKTFGGTLGPYSDKDTTLLTKQITALSADMSPQALEAGIVKLEGYLRDAQKRRRAAFNRDFRGVDLSAAPGTPQQGQGSTAAPASGKAKVVPMSVVEQKARERGVSPDVIIKALRDGGIPVEGVP